MEENSINRLNDALINRKLIIFGCGKFFQEFCLLYSEMVSKIEFIIDNAENIQNSKIEIFCEDVVTTIPIKPVSDILELSPNSFVVLFCSSKHQSMKEQLDRILNFKYLSFFMPLVMDYEENREQIYRLRLIQKTVVVLESNRCVDKALHLTRYAKINDLIKGMKNKEVVAIPRITVVLTPACSLRCKDCNNLMWAFETSKDLDLRKIINSLKNIIESVTFIGCIELIGGEPFLSSNLKDVLEFLVEQNKVLSIEITTNATVMPKPNLIPFLQKENVIVRISNYGNIINQKPFVLEMEKSHINHDVLSKKTWRSAGGINKRNRDFKLLMKQYCACYSSYMCKTLWEECIFPCARAASLSKLGIYNKCPYIDVSEGEDLQSKLIDFLISPVCGACDYCDMHSDDEKLIEPAIQIKRGESKDDFCYNAIV
jgi:hypothetical protein